MATSDVSRGFIERAWDEWRRHCRRQGIVAAFFRLHPLLQNEQFLPSDARVLSERQTVYVDLAGGAERIWAKSKPQYRNKVNKAGTGNRS